MSKQIAIKNKIYETLSEIKGKGSFSDAIEQIMKKSGIAPVHEPTKLQTDASQPQTD